MKQKKRLLISGQVRGRRRLGFWIDSKKHPLVGRLSGRRNHSHCVPFIVLLLLCGMQWSETQDGVCQILKLGGEIDLQHSPELRTLLLAKAKARCPALLIDFSDVSYIDSSGLATLIEYRREAQQFTGKFALGGLSERVRTIFDLVRLNEILSIHPTLAEARSSLVAGP